jgi:hypothetical protein
MQALNLRHSRISWFLFVGLAADVRSIVCELRRRHSTRHRAANKSDNFGTKLAVQRFGGGGDELRVLESKRPSIEPRHHAPRFAH